jgi:hypothetical protein
MVNSLNCIWDCGNAHNHIDDCAGMEEEDQDGQAIMPLFYDIRGTRTRAIKTLI